VAPAAGEQRVAFSGRIGRTALRAGSYRLTAVAAAGTERSAAAVARFRIVRR
jgi:hypothetical protein